jgi:outer membrane receptor protein involved in Fe transport
MHNSALSAFGTFDFRVLERFTFTIGANYTRDAKTVVSDSVGTDAFSALDLAALGPAALALRPYQFLPPFRNFPNAVESGKTRDGDWSWTARLATDLNAQLRTYFSYSGGYKASSFNLSRDSRPSAADLTRLGTAGLLVPNLTAGSRSADLEDSRVFEFGIKADWGNASASLAVFDQAISGFQSNVFTGTGFTLANAGKLKTRGVEFDGQVRPVPAVQLSLAMVYLDPSYDSFPGSALGDLSGTRPAGIPELAATFGVQWSHAMASGDRLIARGDFHYESPVHVVDGLPGFVQRNAAGAVVSYQPAFDAARPFRREVSELNASLTWAMPSGFELSLWGRNLINDRYLVSIFETVIQPGAIFGHANQPRTFGASARFKW